MPHLICVMERGRVPGDCPGFRSYIPATSRTGIPVNLKRVEADRLGHVTK